MRASWMVGSRALAVSSCATIAAWSDLYLAPQLKAAGSCSKETQRQGCVACWLSAFCGADLLAALLAADVAHSASLVAQSTACMSLAPAHNGRRAGIQKFRARSRSRRYLAEIACHA